MRGKGRWFAGLLAALLLLSASCFAEAENLLANGGFEQVDASGNPLEWYASSYRTQEGYSRLVVTEEKAHSGTRSALIENASINDARFVCDVTVEPSSLYKLSGYIWVEDIADQGKGANMALEGIYASSEGLFEATGEWQYLEWYGETGPDQRKLSLGVRIGGYGAETTGKAYFDDIALEKVSALPTGITADLWYEDATYQPESQASTPSAASTGKEKSTLLFVLLGVIFALAAWLARPLLDAEQGNAKLILWIFGTLLAAALILRVWLAMTVAGYQVDINCFKAWSLRMVSVGPTEFYAPDYFCDYPPGAMLLLWPVGALLTLVGLIHNEAALLVVKLIPILCDIGLAIFLFRFASKRLPVMAAAFIGLLYAFDPAALVNGAAWGQMDSLLAFVMVITALYAMEQKWMKAIPLFIVGVLLKPQALLLAPVGGIWLIFSIVSDKSDRKKQLLNALWGSLIAAGVALAVVLPFAYKQERPMAWLVELYSDTLSSYGYATLNTANLYYIMGANWKGLETAVPLGLPLIGGLLLCGVGIWQVLLHQGKKNLQHQGQKAMAFVPLLAGAACLILAVPVGATYQSFGIVMMVMVYLWALLGMCAEGKKESLPYWMAMALIGVYVLGIKVHERYLFVALPLLLMAYATTKDKRMLGLLVGFSVTTFVNTAIVLDNSILFGPEYGHLNTDTLGVNVVLCLLNLLLWLYAAYIGFSGIRESQPTTRRTGEEKPSISREEAYRQSLLAPKDARLHLTGRDFLIMGVTAVLYACLTFTNLGSTVAPQTSFVSTSAQEKIVFEVDTDEPYALLYYAGVSYNNFSVSVSDDNIHWSETFDCQMKEGLCYRWKYAGLMNEYGTFLDDDPESIRWFTGRYLRLNAESPGLNLMEIVVRSEAGERIPLTIISHTGAKTSVLSQPHPAENLLDEQETLKGEPGWYNGTYFDEIYHARTAYEHLHGQAPYEITHPPLGKLMMSAAIAVFGMTPFGWRFAGALIGVLMLPALYLLAKQLFKRRDLATFSMLAFAFDLMHFTQTRIATIDSFPVFFILLSYLCMARYMMTDLWAVGEKEKQGIFTRAYLRSLIPLALSGLFMGLGIASKWIGIYSAVGLAVLLFAALFRQLRTSHVACGYVLDTEDAALADTGNALLHDAATASLTSSQKRRARSAQDFALKRALVTCGFCLIFFVAVPALIYYLSYIPYLAPTGPVTIKRIIAAQEGMLSYHSTPGLGMDHPFQSPWYQWPFILKPIWFCQDHYEPAGYASTIMCLGNPVVFYAGAFAMVAVLIAFVMKYISYQKGKGLQLQGSDGNLALGILSVGFLAQYLPWVLVPRSMYFYHYFASVPFIIMATAWALNHLPEEKRRLRYGVLWGFVAVAAIFFVFFYPFASGILTPTGWLNAMKWFSKIYY